MRLEGHPEHALRADVWVQQEGPWVLLGAEESARVDVLLTPDQARHLSTELLRQAELAAQYVSEA